MNKDTVSGLPLVTRNFTQIAGLSPGVSVGVYNAGELGTGATALSQIGKSNDGIFVHGARSYDNNWQLDGISVSDVQGSGSISGGIPIPNPDTLEEFKVQTGLYDAAFGRGVGANVSVITKSGTATIPRDDFRVFAQRCSQCKRLFFEQNGPAAAEPQAEPVRICARRTNQEGQIAFLWLLSGNAAGKRNSRWSIPDCLHRHLERTTAHQ